MTTTTTLVKQSRIVRIASQEATNSSMGVCQLKMAGLVFGPEQSKTPLPIALLLNDGRMLSVVGAVRDIVVTDSIFGRLDFCGDRESKSVESRWDSCELTTKNLTLNIRIIDGVTVPGENEKPCFLGSGWQIMAVFLNSPTQ